MIRLVHEATRFSNDTYPHAFDGDEQAHVHRLTSEAIESSGEYYLVDLRGQYFVFLVYADWVKDRTANEVFRRVTWGTGHPQTWARVARGARGDMLSGVAPSRDSPAVALRVLREAVVLSDYIGPVLADGQRRMVEVAAGVGTVTTSGMLGHRFDSPVLDRSRNLAEEENDNYPASAVDVDSVRIEGHVTGSLGRAQVRFHWQRRLWIATLDRHQEHDMATGETYFVTTVVGAGRQGPPPPADITSEQLRLDFNNTIARLRETAWYRDGQPSSAQTRQAKLSFAAAYLQALAPVSDPGRAEQVLIPDELRDYAKTDYELHTLATLMGSPIIDVRTWAERKRDFELRDSAT